MSGQVSDAKISHFPTAAKGDGVTDLAELVQGMILGFVGVGDECMSRSLDRSRRRYC